MEEEEGFRELPSSGNAHLSAPPRRRVYVREEEKPPLNGHAQLFIEYLESQCEEYEPLAEERGEPHLSEISLFHSLQIPSLSIRDYVVRIARYASCTPECFIIALLLIHRYQYFTRLSVSLRNVHRLIITAVLVSTKSRDDIFFSNEYFGSIGGLAAREMGSLERHFLKDIQWSTYVDWEEYQDCLYELRKRMPQYFVPDPTLELEESSAEEGE